MFLFTDYANGSKPLVSDGKQGPLPLGWEIQTIYRKSVDVRG
jgi:hypothetical protein